MISGINEQKVSSVRGWNKKMNALKYKKKTPPPLSFVSCHFSPSDFSLLKEKKKNQREKVNEPFSNGSLLFLLLPTSSFPFYLCPFERRSGE